MFQPKKKSVYLLYFIMIPFLHPRGFDEFFSAYSLFFKLWQYISIAIIVVILIIKSTKRVKTKQSPFIVSTASYFIIMLILTLLIRRTLEESIQKIFVAPFVCVFTYLELRRDPKSFIRCINNINLINLTLNLSVFSPIVWKKYFNPISNHMTFLGHVQVCAQIGILCFLFTVLEFFLFPRKHKYRFVYLLIVSIITMITSFTSASYLAVGLILVFYLIDKTRMRRLFTYSSKVYMIAFVALNIFFLYFITNVSIELSIGPLSMSGRGFIWIEALKLVKNSPFFGYGVHGVLVKVFWHEWLNNGLGMNYMHNQTLQVLCDGGVILLIPFLTMLFNSIRSIDHIKKHRLRFWSVVCVLVLLIIMVFESPLEYVYGYIILATFTQIPRLSNTMTSVSKRLIQA